MERSRVPFGTIQIPVPRHRNVSSAPGNGHAPARRYGASRRCERRISMKRLVAAGILLGGLAGTAHAQVDRATLSGEVKDSTGAVMADGTVTATHVATNLARVARSTCA